MRYTLREAISESDLRTFTLFHESVANWLWNRGVKQWRPGEFTVDILHRLRANGGKVYIGWYGGSPVGGFTLQWADEEVWGQREPDAGYLHALWVSREFGGLGLGEALVNDAARLVAEARCEWLRLDCWEGNATLRAYYENQGFRYTGGGLEGWNACYQRPTHI